jgi:ABC-2 type transport system ATP-binding protein
VLEARHLTKYYAALPAIRDVSFRLVPGSVLGLLGPNGSGKSTTVSILTGLLEPSGGQVFVDGADIRDDLTGYKARLGYVPEEAHLYTYLTGPEYLRLIGRLRALPEPALERKIDAFLEIFGLTDDRHAPLSAYSKGMRQKILISAALLHNPSLLIFDEPVSGLDATSALVFRHLLEQLARAGKAVLYCSHELDAVEKTCSRVLVLHHGRVVAHDTVEQLRGTLSKGSLEEVFQQLVSEIDPARTARDLVASMRLGA